MRVLCIGDVFGSTGRRVLAERLEHLRAEQSVDLVIANGENAAGGIGLTLNVFKKLRKYGVDVVTGGNHTMAYAITEPALFEYPQVLRPLNMPPGNQGHGVTTFTLADGRAAVVISLQGRTFFHETYDCPFRAAQAALDDARKASPVIIVDFHAEATSEKAALAHFLDGKVSAVLGTHTHVQTADERVLAGGTAFIADVGMTGPEDSVIGMRKDLVIRRYLLQGRTKLEPARGGAMLNAVLVDIDEATGKARAISRVFERFPFA